MGVCLSYAYDYEIGICLAIGTHRAEKTRAVINTTTAIKNTYHSVARIGRGDERQERKYLTQLHNVKSLKMRTLPNWNWKVGTGQDKDGNGRMLL